MLRLDDPLPPLDGVDHWLNGPPAESPGKPLLVHFWSQSCPACKEDLPTVKRWAEREDLQVVGIHSRTDPAQLDEDAERVVAEAGLGHPVGFDSRGNPTAEAFGLRAVPGYFLFDENGRLRHAHVGPKAAAVTERAIGRVCEAEPGDEVEEGASP